MAGSNSPKHKKMALGYMSEREIERFKGESRLEEYAHFIACQLGDTLYYVEAAVGADLADLDSPFVLQRILGKEEPQAGAWSGLGLGMPFKGRRKDMDTNDISDFIVDSLIEPGVLYHHEDGTAFIIDKARNQQPVTTGGQDS